MPLLQNTLFVPVEKPLLSSFPNRDRQVGTKWSHFVPNLAIGTNKDASAHVAGSSFGPDC